MSNLNTAYPATAYLTGFLRSRGFEAYQADWSIELACRLFSKSGLERRVRRVKPERQTGSLETFLNQFDRYRETVEPVVAFLQGRDPSLDARINSRGWLPEGNRLRRYLDGPATDDEESCGGRTERV